MKINTYSNLLIWACLFWPFLMSAQGRNYYDGPYIFHQDDSLRIQWVEAGNGHDTIIAKSDAGIFDRAFLPVVDLQNIDFQPIGKDSYSGVKKVVALSDIHGQYELMLKLLKANNVIDDKNHWNFGKGHLVINGDNLDRGDRVLDILWYLFYLQKEAEKAGGKVHVLLGNHEIMVLNGDVRYLHKKYRYTSALFQTLYNNFFKEGSVLGDWIASHQVMLSVNEKLFLHAGVSPTILDLKLSIKEVNELFRKQIIRRHEDAIYQDKKLAELYGGNGPLWYRGYFDSLALEVKEVKKTLKRFKQNAIIVGHTSLEAIKSLYGGKVIAIDCRIKLGETGQVLIIENDQFMVGDLMGQKHVLAGDFSPEPVSTPNTPPAKVVSIQTPATNTVSTNSSPTSSAQKPWLFDQIYQMKKNPALSICTDIRQLIKRKNREEYQSAKFILVGTAEEEGFQLNGKIRARGNVRKKVCSLPPVKLDFSKKKLDSLGYLKLDKLKLVLPCSYSDYNQEKLFKEYFLYELYNLIDSNGIRAKLIDIELNNPKKNQEMVGIIVEDEASYAQRKNAKIIEKGRVPASLCDRESFVKMQFFQYMIANTDWSLDNRHNLELVKLVDENKILALPYDFDYSGFVGQEYAVPHESLNIKDIHQRYFFSYKVSDAEFNRVVEFYKSIEDEVYALCDSADYMESRTIAANKNYLKSFFKLLEAPDKLKKNILRR